MHPNNRRPIDPRYTYQNELSNIPQIYPPQRNDNPWMPYNEHLVNPAMHGGYINPYLAPYQGNPSLNNQHMLRPALPRNLQPFSPPTQQYYPTTYEDYLLWTAARAENQANVNTAPQNYSVQHEPPRWHTPQGGRHNVDTSNEPTTTTSSDLNTINVESATDYSYRNRNISYNNNIQTQIVNAYYPTPRPVGQNLSDQITQTGDVASGMNQNPDNTNTRQNVPPMNLSTVNLPTCFGPGRYIQDNTTGALIPKIAPISQPNVYASIASPSPVQNPNKIFERRSINNALNNKTFGGKIISCSTTQMADVSLHPGNKPLDCAVSQQESSALAGCVLHPNLPKLRPLNLSQPRSQPNTTDIPGITVPLDNIHLPEIRINLKPNIDQTLTTLRTLDMVSDQHPSTVNEIKPDIQGQTNVPFGKTFATTKNTPTLTYSQPTLQHNKNEPKDLSTITTNPYDMKGPPKNILPFPSCSNYRYPGPNYHSQNEWKNIVSEPNKRMWSGTDPTCSQSQYAAKKARVQPDLGPPVLRKYTDYLSYSSKERPTRTTGNKNDSPIIVHGSDSEEEPTLPVLTPQDRNF